MKRIYYFGYYTSAANTDNRISFLSATNKMLYIIQVFRKLGFCVEIISPCVAKRKSNGRREYLNKDVSLSLFTSIGRGSKIRNILDRCLIKIQVFFYLLNNVKNGDTITVYHSTSYMGILSLFKKIKKLKLILEVEEIYSDITHNKRLAKKEYKFFDNADAFILSTELLNKKVNKDNKPYTVIHGTYQVEPDREGGFNDGKIHIVYAGTFDRRKGGAIAAAAAEHLPFGYHIHILGFGKEEDKQFLLNEIERVSQISRCKVTFDGLLSGEEYIRFIQCCDIGLSTQNPDADFNDTSFPSKILSYMANGLRVVSVRIPAIESSSVGEYMYYYDVQSPKSIADAIMSVDMKDGYDGRKIISSLDKRFSEQISELLG